MILESLAAGVFFGLIFAVARRYPWYGALCLFAALTLLGIALAEYVYSEVGKVGIFGVLLILPFAAIPETRKALSKQQIAPGHMTYIYGVYGAMVALPLWGIARIVQIVSK